MKLIINYVMLQFMVIIQKCLAIQLPWLSNDDISTLFWAIGILTFIGYIAYQQLNKSNSVFDSSILLSLHTTGLLLEPITNGKLSTGFKYSLMMTSPMPTTQQDGPMQFSNADSMISDSLSVLALQSQNLTYAGKIFMTLTLPTKHYLHVACLGLPDDQTRSNFDDEIAQHNLEPVTLEGDFPNYFSLYTSPGTQSAVRELLDPGTMAFLVDYCKKQDWELIDNMLYFAQNSVNEKTDEPSRVDNTTMVQDAEEFAKIVLSKLSQKNV